MKLIDKDALVAEIEKKLQDLIACVENTSFIEQRVVLMAKIDMCKEILSFLDTIEVKEVDLEEEFDRYCDNLYIIDVQNEPYAELFDCAKYFFELGLNAGKEE